MINFMKKSGKYLEKEVITMANEEKSFQKGSINWASHIYAKLPLNPYKIRELEKRVFTHFRKNEESFNNFITGKKLKLVYKKSIIKNNSKILVYKRREEL